MIGGESSSARTPRCWTPRCGLIPSTLTTLSSGPLCAPRVISAFSGSGADRGVGILCPQPVRHGSVGSPAFKGGSPARTVDFVVHLGPVCQCHVSHLRKEAHGRTREERLARRLAEDARRARCGYERIAEHPCQRMSGVGGDGAGNGQV